MLSSRVLTSLKTRGCTVMLNTALYQRPVEHRLSACLVAACPLSMSSRRMSYVTVEENKPGFAKRILKRVGWLDTSRSVLKAGGYFLYESVADKLDYNKFFQECELPDTFFSWFLVTELHVWMLMARVMREGDEGRYSRNTLAEAMWQDINTRLKQIEGLPTTVIRQQLKELGYQFQAALFTYDEGIQDHDRVLAAALWSQLFQKNCQNPCTLEMMVCYVRKQLKLLDELSRKDVLEKANIKWTPLDKR